MTCWAAAPISHRSHPVHKTRGAVKPGSSGFQQDGHPVDDRRDMRAHPTHPVGKNRPFDREAVTGHDPHLTVQRHMFRMFGHGNMRQHRFGGPTALQQMRRGPGLRHARAPLGAGVFRADGDHHTILAGTTSIRSNWSSPPLGDCLAITCRSVDPHHIATAASPLSLGVATDRAIGPSDDGAPMATRQCCRARSRARPGASSPAVPVACAVCGALSFPDHPAHRSYPRRRQSVSRFRPWPSQGSQAPGAIVRGPVFRIQSVSG